MATLDFGGVKETVVTRKEFSLTKARKTLKKETIAVIGYGVQGPAQALNMRDNGFNVIIGQAKRFRKDWNRAVKDGWVPGETLFDNKTFQRNQPVIVVVNASIVFAALFCLFQDCAQSFGPLLSRHHLRIDKSGNHRECLRLPGFREYRSVIVARQ